jgi:hypothetical protein
MRKEEEIMRVCNVCEKEKPITSFSINGRKGYRRKSCKLCYATRFERMEIIIDKDNLKEKMCKACMNVKDMKSFHKNNLFKDGYDSRCKLCKQMGKTITVKGGKSEYKRRISGSDEEIRLSSVHTEDWLETYDLLKLMGYDLTKNIAEQFCSKYNLPYKEKNDRKGLYKTPKDLGLI